MRWLRNLAFAAVLSVGMACSLILDFDLEVECWCGERWTVQIAGAEAFGFQGAPVPILASETTYEVCVSQLEHLALDTADPQDPLYMALRETLEGGAIAKCEVAGAQAVEFYFTGTNCATTGTDPVSTNFVHAGACWNAEKYDLDDTVCPVSGECRAYYDCSSEPIVSVGDDEAGGEGGLAWECDEPGFAEAEIQR